VKKRKIKRIQPKYTSVEVLNVVDEHEKMREQAFLDLVARIIVSVTLREYYGDGK
jgi:hypothetical protein